MAHYLEISFDVMQTKIIIIIKVIFTIKLICTENQRCRGVYKGE